MNAKDTWDDGPEGHSTFTIHTEAYPSQFTVGVKGDCACGETISCMSGARSNARRLAVLNWRRHYEEVAHADVA